MDLEEKFKNACDAIHNVKNIENDDLLKLYGLFKQATVGNCDIPQPSMFSSQKNKLKYNAWLMNKNMDKKTAMKMYIYTVELLST